MEDYRFSQKITRTSFWLSICVVFIHANNTLTYQFDMNNRFERLVYIFENWVQGCQQCAVPLFFIISGFLFFKNYSPNKLISKWKSRCKTLLIPYLIWTNIPWFLLSIVKLTPWGKSIHTSASFTIDSWIEFVIYCNGTVLWYVRATLIFVLLTPIIYSIINLKQIGFLIILSLMFVNIIMLSLEMDLIEEQYWCMPYLLGGWLAIWKPDFFIKRAKRQNIIIAGAVFILFILIAINSQITLFNPITQFIYKMCIPLPLWFALDIFNFEKPILWFERTSFPIYCTHAILLELIEKVIYISLGNNIIVALFSYIVTPIFVTIILLLIFFNAKKHFSSIYRLVFGSRG